MDEIVFENVRKGLLEAESRYLRNTKEAHYMVSAINAVEKMYELRDAKIERGDETGPIDRLIADTEGRLQRELRVGGASTQEPVDYKSWVHELQCALRLHDPFMLSFDSATGEEKDGEEIVAPHSFSTKSGVLTFLKKDDKMFNHWEGSSQRRVNRVNNMTIVAWTFASLAMLVTIGFLTSDFVSSQKNPGIHIEQIPASQLELPAISFCNPIEGLPSFDNFPTAEYRGIPLFTIAQIQNEHSSPDGVSLVYPNSTSQFSMGVIEETFEGRNKSKCLADTTKMSIERQRQGLFRGHVEKTSALVGHDIDPDPCLKCFRIGASKRQVVHENFAREITPYPLSITLLVLNALDVCRTMNGRSIYGSVGRNLMRNEVIKHSSELEAREILVLSPEYDGDIESAVNELRKLGATTLDRILCNVYFFAGFFYPSENEGQVQYTFRNVSTPTWTFTGSMEYSFSTWDLEAPFAQSTDPERAAKDVFTLAGLELYFEDPNAAAGTELVSANSDAVYVNFGNDVSIAFDREDHKSGAAQYTHQASNSNSDVVHAARYSRINLEFGYRFLATNQIVLQPSMSWSEYVTDIFEFVGLFTGVCIFSLIVAPAQQLV